MQRILWCLSLLAGVAVIVIGMMFGQIPDQVACDGDTALGAVLRFELVTSPADVARFFGTGDCLLRLTTAMDAVNRLDSLAFIPAFTLFQLFAAFALRRQALGDGWCRLVAFGVINAALVAGACDYLENIHLLETGWAVRSGNPADAAAINQLYWLVRVKFALLGLASIGLGWLVTRRSGAGWRIAGGAIMLGGTVTLVGLAAHALLAPGLMLSWSALLGVAVVSAVRPDTAPD
jgi:hypothetical protein